MKITLQKPFSDKWRSGWLRLSKDGRRRVDLYNSNVNRTTISYAKYLKSVDLGYVIPEDFEVDRINEDRSDDSLSNLQVLHKSEHYKKSHICSGRTRSYTQLVCSYCGTPFTRPTNLVHSEYENQFCSRSCSGANSRR